MLVLLLPEKQLNILNMLQLKINNQIYSGWTGARITRGLKQVASTFYLTVTDKWEHSEWQIRPFDECEIVYNDQLIISGYIDNVSVSHDAEQHSVTVEGRSKTADLVDCSAPSKQYKNSTLLSIAKAIASPFNINVKSDIEEGEQFSIWKADEGVSAFEALDKLARLRGVLLTDTQNGDLLITKASIINAPGRLELGKNIKSATASFNAKDRFSRYTLKGQQHGSDTVNPTQAAHVNATADDKTVSRYRPLIINAEEQVDLLSAKRRVNWEKNTRIGLSLSSSITVVGWEIEGQLWQPNRLVKITDKLIGLDAKLLIISITYSLDENGTLATMDLQPKESMLSDPTEQKPETTPVINTQWKRLTDA